MKLIFVCPAHNRTFESENYAVVDNRGVVTGPSGEKMLDAAVLLTEPCPFCGERHRYHASELACPFGGS